MRHLLQFLCHVTSYRPINYCRHAEDSYSLKKKSVNYVNTAEHYRKVTPLNVSLISSDRVDKTCVSAGCSKYIIRYDRGKRLTILDSWVAVLNSGE